MRAIWRSGIGLALACLTVGVAWGETQTHTYTAPGTYDACVTATDQYGLSTTTCVPVSVRGNSAPVVELVADPATGLAPLAVTFTATLSDPDGDTVTTTWDYGD